MYVHARPTLKDYKEPSVFAGRLIPDRTVGPSPTLLQGKGGLSCSACVPSKLRAWPLHPCQAPASLGMQARCPSPRCRCEQPRGPDFSHRQIAKPDTHAIAAAAKKLVEVAVLDQRNEWFVLVGDTTGAPARRAGGQACNRSIRGNLHSTACETHATAFSVSKGRGQRRPGRCQPTIFACPPEAPCAGVCLLPDCSPAVPPCHGVAAADARGPQQAGRMHSPGGGGDAEVVCPRFRECCARIFWQGAWPGRTAPLPRMRLDPHPRLPVSSRRARQAGAAPGPQPRHPRHAHRPLPARQPLAQVWAVVHAQPQVSAAGEPRAVPQAVARAPGPGPAPRGGTQAGRPRARFAAAQTLACGAVHIRPAGLAPRVQACWGGARSSVWQRHE